MGGMLMLAQVTVHSESYDLYARQASMHVSSHARTSVGDYSNEYCLFFEFDRCGTKIKKIQEFIDSAYTKGFFQRLEESQGRR